MKQDDCACAECKGRRTLDSVAACECGKCRGRKLRARWLAMRPGATRGGCVCRCHNESFPQHWTAVLRLFDANRFVCDECPCDISIGAQWEGCDDDPVGASVSCDMCDRGEHANVHPITGEPTTMCPCCYVKLPGVTA